MSLIEDSLLVEKLAAVRLAEQAVKDEKNNYYLVLGEWLENALQDDNEHLQALFISEADNKNYLSRKGDRNIAKRIADKLSAINRTKSSEHVQSMIQEANTDNQDRQC